MKNIIIETVANGYVVKPVCQPPFGQAIESVEVAVFNAMEDLQGSLPQILSGEFFKRKEKTLVINPHES